MREERFKVEAEDSAQWDIDAEMLVCALKKWRQRLLILVGKFSVFHN